MLQYNQLQTKALRCFGFCLCLMLLGTLVSCMSFMNPQSPKPQQPTATRLPSTTTTQPKTSAQCIVLALPDSGNFAPFAQKIRTGAAAAQREFSSVGYQLEIKSVDTATPNWVEQLNALPAQCAVVGGPMQAQEFTSAQKAGILGKRVFFSFLPQLGAGVEGTTAWRFFPSPQDQTQSLVNFVKSTLGINSFGAFYPADNYGTRMTAIFEKTVQQHGGTVRSASYAPKEMVQWAESAKKLLQPRMVNNVPVPTAAFKATFLPDSWKNMDMVTNSLIYNGGTHQVLIGTSLWGLSLTQMSHVNMTNYQLAIFPAAWNPQASVPALQSLPSQDFWTALGYDFARFAANLALTSAAPASDVNARIQQAQNFVWALAPMQWSTNGKASQQLHIFTPTATGCAPVNVPAFVEQYNQAQTRLGAYTRPVDAQQ